MKKKNNKIPALKWGLISGFIIIIYGGLMDLAGLKQGLLAEIIGYLSIVILPIGIYMGMREYRLKSSQGFQWWKALLLGISIALICACLISVYRYISLNFFADVLNVETLEERVRSRMEAKDATEEEILRKLKEVQEKYPPGSTYINTFKWYTVLGVLYSSVSFLINYVKFKRT